MIQTEGITGADTLLRVLAQMGIDRIFSSPGSEWAPVWEAFAKAKAQSEGVPLYITSRHEEVAVRHGERIREINRQAARGHDPHHRRRSARDHGAARRVA